MSYANNDNAPASGYVQEAIQAELDNQLQSQLEESETYLQSFDLVKQREGVNITEYVLDQTTPLGKELVTYNNGVAIKNVYDPTRINGKISQTTYTEDEANLKLPNVDIGVNVIEKAYFTQNKIGSITTATNKYGENMYYTKYDSWGTIEVEENIQDINYTTLDKINNYTGHSYDYVLGQYNAKNRMYDPVNKRFTTIDQCSEKD